jgi:putative transposase
LVRTEPLKALVIGAFVRGLSMRDVESLCEQAGLGRLSNSTASRVCAELRERFEAFKRRDLYDIRLVALFLDATYLAVRPDGPKEGVLVAWGFTEQGERVLLSVMLGMRESHEDWLELGRDLIARGLGAPMLIVADGAPGLIGAIERCWPASDRQRCSVHRARNLYAKLPERERERVKQAYWQALDDAISEQDAKQRLQALVDQLDKAGFTAAAKCLADDLDALVVHLRYPPRHRRRWRSTNLLERSLGEVKRRTKVMGRFPGEQSCLSLVWAVLDLPITHETNGIRLNQLDRQRLTRIRYQDHEQAIPEEVTAA